MQNKTVIVTGAGRGIGLAVAERLLREGAKVVIAECDAEAGRRAIGLLAAGERCRFVETDVADENSVASMVAGTLETFGAIDGLVNNAGLADGHSGPVESLSLDAWQRVIAVNLTGVFLCAKHAVPALRKARGAIVNIASTRALMSEPETTSYAASKGGVVALTHSLALSLGPDVRVNCVSPGWIDVRGWRTGLDEPVPPLAESHHRHHPVGRVGSPRDIAAMVLHLLSPEQGFVTGQNLVVDGGMTKKMIYR